MGPTEPALFLHFVPPFTSIALLVERKSCWVELQENANPQAVTNDVETILSVQHLFIHSLTYSLTHARTHAPTHFPFTVMGLALSGKGQTESLDSPRY